MGSYWYSTNGMNQRRLSNRNVALLDRAFERHTRIQIYDDEVFGVNVPAIANPYQGTMTAGDLHFGLYRQPPMWRMSDTSLDTLILMDCTNITSNDDDDDNNGIKNNHSTGSNTNRNHNNNSNNINNNNSNNNNNNNSSTYYKFIQRKKVVSKVEEENCICCRIS